MVDTPTTDAILNTLSGDDGDDGGGSGAPRRADNAGTGIPICPLLISKRIG
jgi:hypothetical protein